MVVVPKGGISIQRPVTDASNPVGLATTTISSIRYSDHDVLPATLAAPRHAAGVRAI